MTYLLFTDGGARGNPGPAGAGVVLLDEQKNIVMESQAYLGKKTNNEAEYSGLILGLRIAEKKSVKNIICNLDSQLVVKQLNGEYKVKNARLAEYFKKVKDLEKSFDNITYKYVPRAENAHADSLVNAAIDEATS